jgi:hypothetical protein
MYTKLNYSKTNSAYFDSDIYRLGILRFLEKLSAINDSG